MRLCVLGETIMSVRATNTTPNLTFLDARRGLSTAAIDWYGAKEQKLDEIIRRLNALDGGGPASTSINTVSSNLTAGLKAMRREIQQNKVVIEAMQLEIQELKLQRKQEQLETADPKTELEILRDLDEIQNRKVQLKQEQLKDIKDKTSASLDEDVSQLQV